VKKTEHACASTTAKNGTPCLLTWQDFDQAAAGIQRRPSGTFEREIVSPVSGTACILLYGGGGGSKQDLWFFF
jgi:hypothetical protein